MKRAFGTLKEPQRTNRQHLEILSVWQMWMMYILRGAWDANGAMMYVSRYMIKLHIHLDLGVTDRGKTQDSAKGFGQACTMLKGDDKPGSGRPVIVTSKGLGAFGAACGWIP
jgi:hypothetical protein